MLQPYVFLVQKIGDFDLYHIDYWEFKLIDSVRVLLILIWRSCLQALSLLLLLFWLREDINIWIIYSWADYFSTVKTSTNNITLLELFLTLLIKLPYTKKTEMLWCYTGSVFATGFDVPKMCLPAFSIEWRKFIGVGCKNTSAASFFMFIIYIYIKNQVHFS